jgi:hypothetical protein
MYRNGTKTDSGAVYVFAAAGSTPLLTINNPDAAAFDDYGSAIAVTSVMATSSSVLASRTTSPRTTAACLCTMGLMVNSCGLWLTLLQMHRVRSPPVLQATPDSHVVVGAANDDSGAINSGRVFVYNGSDGALIKIIDNPEPGENVNFGQGLAVTPNGQIAVGAFGAAGGFGKLHLFASVGEGEPLTPINEVPIH